MADGDNISSRPKIDDGGPAFPLVAPFNRELTNQYFDGMTLRDYFAAKAMQGMLANPTARITPDGTRSDVDVVAEASYSMADAMLKARQ